MTDNQLYDFFKTQSSSFDEMPSDIVWNKINKELRPENAPISNTITLKKIALLVLATALVSFLIYLFSDKSELAPSSPVKKETITKDKGIIKIDSDIQEKFKKTTSDTTKRKRIPFRRIGLLPAKQIVPITSNTIGILPDSIKTIKPKANDTLKHKPQILGNRYLYENKKELTKEEFDLFVQEVLKENEQQYGRLLVIKSKGHIPIRKLIKKDPQGIQLTHDTAKLSPKPAFFRSRIIVDTISNGKRDSILPSKNQ